MNRRKNKYVIKLRKERERELGEKKREKQREGDDEERGRW